VAGRQLIDAVCEALRRRRSNSGTRGRKRTPAEVALRLLVLKHMRNWNFDILEREVRANMVYRLFTRVGAEKVGLGVIADNLIDIGRILAPQAAEV
jgi:IS5 family transposase